MKRISKFCKKYLHIIILALTALTCFLFITFGTKSENGYITLDGKDAKIEEYTEEFISDSQKALKRIMNESQPTDEETIKENNVDEVGLGFHTTLEEILARRLPDGDNDNGKGWQCSKYTAYLATGKREYSTTHPDYGPVNGKDIASWLVRNYGFKYIDNPVPGAIGSAGFNTKYGHTAMYVGDGYVNDANYKPLSVYTHPEILSNYKWVVPGDYNPKPEPTPTPTPTPEPVASCKRINVNKGDTLSAIMKRCEGKVDWSRMNNYAMKWYSTKVKPGQSVYSGWNSYAGVGLYAGDVIEYRE